MKVDLLPTKSERPAVLRERDGPHPENLRVETDGLLHIRYRQNDVVYSVYLHITASQKKGPEREAPGSELLLCPWSSR